MIPTDLKMKKILSIFVLALTCMSCSDLTSYNDNPNNPSEVNPQYVLTSVCRDAFYRGTDGMYAQKMVIQTDGQNSEQFYKWDRGSFDIYSTSLLQVKKMEEEAQRTSSDVYLALSKFFRAYYFYNLTLTFGDIPCSDALKGQTDGVFMPKYDTQEEVFASILQNLSDADDELAKETGSSIAGDIIYNGDVTSWRKLINSFHLKVLMTLSHHVTAGSHNIVDEFRTIAAKPLMESNADNGQLTYLDQESCRYPQFNAQWSGYYMDKTYVNRMAEREDPRLFLFCLPTNEAATQGKAVNDFSAYAGGDPIVPYDENIELVKDGKISQINSRFRTDAIGEPTMLMGYAELQQIMAEAVVRGWISGDAKTYYENGVKASFLFYQTYAKTYSQYVTPAAASKYLLGDKVKFTDDLTTDEKIERIIFQKYCTDFYQGNWDGFFENRRTGYPAFAHTTDTQIPNRWMYPSTEYKHNTDNLTEAVARQFGANNDNTHATPWWMTGNN